MDKQVLLGGQSLHGSDRFGQWITEAIEGWDEPPAVRDSDVERPLAHGSFDVPSFYADRTPTLDGILLANSRAQGLEAVRRLAGSASLATQKLEITDAGLTQWAGVKLAGLDYTWVTNSDVRWQLRLKAPDPRKFGKVHIEELTGGQSRSLYHYGNIEAAPLVEIRGPITGGYQINSNDGRVFRVNSGIASGARHTIDMNDGLLRVNGRVQAGLVGQADVWKIPPGLLPSGGTLNMALKPDVASQTPVGSVYITDTYI